MSKADTIAPIVFGLFVFSFISMSLFEYFGARYFIDRLYFWGLRLINFQEQWGDFKFQKNFEVKETLSGKFKVINDSTALFRYNYPLISFYKINTPLSFKGVIELKEGRAIISGRIPLAPSIFIFTWLLAWTVIGLYIILFTDIRLYGLVIFFGGYIFLGATLGSSYFLEKKRFEAVFNEIKQSLGISFEIESKNIRLSFFELKYTLSFVAIVSCLVFLAHHFFPNK